MLLLFIHAIHVSMTVRRGLLSMFSRCNLSSRRYSPLPAAYGVCLRKEYRATAYYSANVRKRKESIIARRPIDSSDCARDAREYRVIYEKRDSAASKAGSSDNFQLKQISRRERISRPSHFLRLAALRSSLSLSLYQGRLYISDVLYF